MFDVARLHPKGRKEVAAFNNDTVMMCFFCIEELKGKTAMANDRDLLR